MTKQEQEPKTASGKHLKEWEFHFMTMCRAYESVCATREDLNAVLDVIYGTDEKKPFGWDQDLFTCQEVGMTPEDWIAAASSLAHSAASIASAFANRIVEERDALIEAKAAQQQ